jgi:hypothetical protein
MSKKLSYRGTLAMGTEEKIRLKTIKGKIGYKITKFDMLTTTPGTGNVEMVGKITKVPDPNIGPTVQFTDLDMLAVNYLRDGTTNERPYTQVIIFDNEITNQNIFVNIDDAGGATTACNYLIELEAFSISDLEATQLTLKNIRTITSR